MLVFQVSIKTRVSDRTCTMPPIPAGRAKDPRIGGHGPPGGNSSNFQRRRFRCSVTRFYQFLGPSNPSALLRKVVGGALQNRPGTPMTPYTTLIDPRRWSNLRSAIRKTKPETSCIYLGQNQMPIDNFSVAYTL